MKQIRQVITTGIGKNPEMKLINSKIVDPNDNEVQVQIMYSGFAWADVVMKSGNYPKQPKKDFVQGYDIVGKVVSVGSKISKEWVGKEIAAIIQWGGFSEYINLDESHLIEVPKELDLKEIEALILNYSTAYQIINRVANLKDEQTILVHGGAGGVGTAFLELAKLRRIKCYATASSGKRKIVESLGGIFIDYKTERFEEKISLLELSGIDAFFDFNGGETFDRSFKLLKKGGIGVVYNFQEADSVFKIILYFMKFVILNAFSSKKVQFFSLMGRYFKNKNEYFDDLRSLFQLLSSNKIKPIIGSIVSLSEVPKEHLEFEKNKFVGKVLVDCSK